MINFRFHIVSLIAVFLALGVGILVGSTVVDQKIVNRLDREISSVSKENKARKAASSQLAQQNSQLQQFIDQSEPFAGDFRLQGFSIAVVAERGVSGGSVKKAEAALHAAGAVVPAVLWLDDNWLLDSDSRVQELGSALELSGSASIMRDAALRLVAQRLTTVPKPKATSTSTAAPASVTSTVRSTSTSSPPSTPPVDTLAALEHAGFLSVTDGNASAFDGFPTQAVDVLVITGDDSHFVGTDLTSAFARALTLVKVPTMVAAVYDAGSDAAREPKRGAALVSVLDDHALSRVVSTVDDLELAQGRVAMVLALASGNVGHYGYGSGASAPVPPHR